MATGAAVGRISSWTGWGSASRHGATPVMIKRLLSALVLLPIFLLIVVKAPAFLFNLLVVAFSCGS